ncbi:MAG: hypothetical protein IMZ51_03990 [Chloroflexi bacterium]|nr:hypothetical protein [Chloroflexota bacterium]
MTYSSTTEIWKNLGKDAYTKVRGEIVGTSSTTASTNYELEHDNTITSSVILYTNSSILTSSAYSLNLDDGNIIGLTGATSGSVLTADYDYGDIPDSVVSKMISSSDAMIDLETGRSFGSNTGNVEYISVEESQNVFFLKNYPVITLSSVEVNTVSPTDPPNWTTSTIGLGNDYLANSEDLSLGRIRFINNFPYIGVDTLKVTYDYGYSTTPSLANELSILLTIRQMTNSSLYKSIFKGYDNFTPVRLAEIENRIEELKRILKKQSISLI